MPVDTALHKAANKGDKGEVEEILAKGEIAVDAPGAGDRTALQRAIGSNVLSCAKLLLEKGADVNKQDKAGRAPIHWACIGGHNACLELLLEKGAKVNVTTKSAMTPLAAAAEGGRVECVKTLLAYDARIEEGTAQGERLDKEAKDSNDKTAFDLAKAGKHKEIEQLLKTGSSACIIS